MKPLLLLIAFACTTLAERRAFNKADVNNFNQLVADSKHHIGNNNAENTKKNQENISNNSDDNVEATIREVEKLLKSNPSLPRLTRGEILDIIDNLTQVDLDKKYKDSFRDQKAIMYVMPYSVDNVANEDVQELYTKPPVTQIIGETSTEKVKRRKPIKKPYEYSTTTTSKPFSIEDFKQSTDSTVNEAMSSPTAITRTSYRRRKPTTNRPYSEVVEEVTKSSAKVTTTTTMAPRITSSTVQPFRRIVPTTYKPKTSLPDDAIVFVNPPQYHKNLYKNSESHKSPQIKGTLKPTLPSIEINKPNLDEIPNDFKEVLKNLDLLIKPTADDSSLSASSSDVKDLDLPNDQDKLKSLLEALNQYTTTTTTTQAPEVEMAGNLTPDMRELLMSFGLIPNPDQQPMETPTKDTYLEPDPVISPESYTNFKPLPQTDNVTPSDDMEELLAQFGLANSNRNGKHAPNENNNKNGNNKRNPNDNRNGKAISSTKPKNNLEKPLSFEAVPDHLKGVITDLGLSKDMLVKDITSSQTIAKESDKHVFSPSDLEYATEEELNKLKKLMDVIKELEKLNSTVTDEDIKHIDMDSIKSLITSVQNVPLNEQKAPNPIDFDTSVAKNEVKRQQSTTTTANPAFEALEESFGGAPPAPEVTEEVMTPPPISKKTGFYYLVDWNSFFDIDNQKGKRVNLRFQPTIGDPKRFLSVTVP